MDSSSEEVENQDMAGKLCIVTGATSGIGREIALGLGRLGGEVVLVGRSQEKCESIRNEIVSLTANRNIGFELSELSSMDSVKKLAETLTSQNSRIDVLINNAGGVFSKHRLTADGFERTIALNYLSPVLLTRLLLPSMTTHGHSRIINIGSGAHIGGRAVFDFKYPWRYAAMRAYSTSKLMFTMFSYSLARRLKGANISSTLVQPGFVATNLGRSSGSALLSASFSIMRPFQISANEAAKTPVYLASSVDFGDLNGKCFSKMKAIQTSQVSYNDTLQEELWKKTSSALGLPVELELQ